MLEKIQLALLCFAGVIFVLPILWGFIRGWKKGLFRFIWQLVITIVLFFTSFLIAKAIVNFDLTKFGVDLEGHKTLSSYVVAMLQEIEQIREIISYSESFQSILTLVPTLLGSLVLFVLLYWLLKWLLWPIWAILSRIFIKKYKVSYNEGKKIKTKKKKGRLLGAGTGILLGYLSLTVTMVPIVGISQFAKDLDRNYTLNNGLGVITSTLEDMGEGTSEYLNYYEGSTLQQLLKYSGIDALSGVMFKELTTSQDKNRISLTDEANQMIGVYADITVLQTFDSENITQEQLDNYLVRLRSMITRIFESHIVDTLVDEIVPDLIQSAIDGNSTIMTLPTLENDIFQEAMMDSIRTLTDLNGESIKNELLAVLDVIDVINEERVLLPLLKNPSQKEVLHLFANVSDEFGTKMADALFGFSHLVSVTPILMNAVVEYACEEFDATYVESDVDMEKVKAMLAGCIDCVIVVLNDVDTKVDYYVSKATISQVADTIDAIMDSTLVTDTTKQSLLTKAKDALLKQYDKLELPAELKQIVDDFATATISLDSFASELKIFGEAYLTICEDTDGKFTSETFQNLKLEDLGSWLDILTKSSVYNTTFNSLFDNGIDYLLTFIPDDLTSLDNPVRELSTNLKIVQAQAKIFNAQSGVEKGLWEIELGKLQTFYNNIVSVTKNLENLDTAITETDVLLNLGIAFDSVLGNNSQILKKTNLDSIFGAILDVVALPEEIKDITVNDQTILEQLKENITGIDGTEITWVDELQKVKHLLSADLTVEKDGVYQLTNLGEVLDMIKSSQLFGNMIPDIFGYFIDEMKDSFDSESDLDKMMISVLDGVKGNVADVTSFQEELLAVDSILNTDLNAKDLTTIGILLDDLASTKLFGNQMTTILNYYVDEYTKDLNADYQSVITLIKANFATLEAGDYSIELEYIADISDLLGKDTLTQEDIDALVDTLVDDQGQSTSKIITNEVIQEMIEVTFDVVVKTALADYADDEFITAVKENIGSVDNITTLLDDIEELKTVATDLTESVATLDDVKANETAILEAVDTLYENDVVGSDATKVVTELTLEKVNDLVESDATLDSTAKAEITEAIAEKTIALQTATTAEEYKNALSDIINLLG